MGVTIYFYLYSQTKTGRGAKNKNTLVNTRVGYSAHEDDSVQSNFPYKNQEGPVGLEGHPVGVQRTASDHNGGTSCCFTAFLVYLPVREQTNAALATLQFWDAGMPCADTAIPPSAVCYPGESTPGSGRVPSGTLLLLSSIQ